MRKKILFTIVFVAMTISLTSCGNKNVDYIHRPYRNI